MDLENRLQQIEDEQLHDYLDKKGEHDERAANEFCGSCANFTGGYGYCAHLEDYIKEDRNAYLDGMDCFRERQ